MTFGPHNAFPRRFAPVARALAVLHATGLLVPALGGQGVRASLLKWLGLTPSAAFGRLRLWQLVTHSFLYRDGGELLVCLVVAAVLLIYGSRLEAEWGARRFLWFYVLMATLTGLARAMGGANVAVSGGMGVFYATLAAAACLWRGQRVALLFWSVNLWTAIWVIAAISVVAAMPSPEWLWVAGVPLGALYVRAGALMRPRRGATPPRFSGLDLDE